MATATTVGRIGSVEEFMTFRRSIKPLQKPSIRTRPMPTVRNNFMVLFFLLSLLQTKQTFSNYRYWYCDYLNTRGRITIAVFGNNFPTFLSWHSRTFVFVRIKIQSMFIIVDAFYSIDLVNVEGYVIS